MRPSWLKKPSLIDNNGRFTLKPFEKVSKAKISFLLIVLVIYMVILVKALHASRWDGWVIQRDDQPKD